MRRSLSKYLRLSVAVGMLLLGLGAYGKKQPPAAATPDLAAPERAVPSGGRMDAAEKVAAQAEVKASSGPIELGLLLYKTEIKLGDSLWHQLRIRNVGSEQITVLDPVFFDPWEWLRQCRAGYGVYIEVRGPDGKPLEVAPHPYLGGSDASDKPSGLLEVEGPEEQAMLDGWKKRGLSSHEINQRLLDFNLKKQRAADLRRERPKFKLQPGESVETKSWFFYSEWDQFKKRPLPQAVGDFAELEFFDLDKPGTYQVRAVYDRAPTAKLMEMRGKIPVEADEILVRTPWIKVSVLP